MKKSIPARNAENKTGTVINIPVFIPDKELDYILSNCFEGGSNYWITNVEVYNNDFKGKEFASEVISAGGYLNITEDCREGDKPVIHELSKPRLINGLMLYFSKEKTLDFDQMDSGQSDLVLQYSLFNEIKYG